MHIDKVKKFLAAIENSIFMIFCIIVILFLVQLFRFTSFKIPSDFVGPALKDGNRILVNKMIKGARLSNMFATLGNEDVTIYRTPGLGYLRGNDILVFSFPYQMNRWDSVRMNVMQYYMKRCIALPGGTLKIRGGFYKVRRYRGQLGSHGAQQYLVGLRQPGKRGIVAGTFPYDQNLGQNIREFGLLPIPRKDQIVIVNHITCPLYRRLTAWEQRKKIELKQEQVSIGDSLIHQYCSKKNYHPVSGDNMANSQDSRHWRTLPEEYIVSKATRIWSSKEKYTDRIR